MLRTLGSVLLIGILLSIITLNSANIAVADDTDGNTTTTTAETTSETIGSILVMHVTDTQNLLSESRNKINENIMKIHDDYGVNVWVVIEPSIGNDSPDFDLEKWCTDTAKMSGFTKDDILLVIETSKQNMALWVPQNSEYFNKKVGNTIFNMVNSYLTSENWNEAIVKFVSIVREKISESQNVFPYVLFTLLFFVLIVFLSYSRLNSNNTSRIVESSKKRRLGFISKRNLKKLDQISNSAIISSEVTDILIQNVTDAEDKVYNSENNAGDSNPQEHISNALSTSEITTSGNGKDGRKQHDVHNRVNLLDRYIHGKTRKTEPNVNIEPQKSETAPSNDNDVYADYYKQSFSREAYGSYYFDSKDNTETAAKNTPKQSADELDYNVQSFMNKISLSPSNTDTKDPIKKYYAPPKKNIVKNVLPKKGVHGRFEF